MVREKGHVDGGITPGSRNKSITHGMLFSQLNLYFLNGRNETVGEPLLRFQGSPCVQGAGHPGGVQTHIALTIN